MRRPGKRTIMELVIAGIVLLMLAIGFIGQASADTDSTWGTDSTGNVVGAR